MTAFYSLIFKMKGIDSFRKDVPVLLTKYFVIQVPDKCHLKTALKQK